MRRSTRTFLMALMLAIIPLAATGCGGSEVSADEVPGPPAALTVPSDSDLSSGGSGNRDDAADSGDSSTSDDSSDTGADDATGGATTPETGTTTPSTDGTSGGTPTPEAGTTPDDTATNDTPPAGAEAEQFESFCEQNAGAC